VHILLCLLSLTESSPLRLVKSQMPLDPLSALSVAACVVQFVDFAAKVVSKGKDIYSSQEGVLEENSFAETVTIRLKEKVKALETSYQSGQHITIRSEKAQILARGRVVRLKDIIERCTQLSQELLDKLGSLEVPKGSEFRKWKSFRQALKSVWSKQEIDAISEKLRYLRAELDSEIINELRQVQSFKCDSSPKLTVLPNRDNMDDLSREQNRHFQEISENTQAIKDSIVKNRLLFIQRDEYFWKLNRDTQIIIKDLLKNNVSQSEELRRHFEELTESQKQEHAKTRATFIRVDTEKRKKRIELDLLESLRFPQIMEQYERVAKNHEKTLSWIFEPSQDEKPWDNFVEWPRSSHSIYWI
jgi:hypothetical protein